LGVGFGETIAEIGLEGDVLEQVLHGFVEFLVRSIRNFEAVLAGGLECSGVLMAQVAFDTNL
jgi:hypothetical protein